MILTCTNNHETRVDNGEIPPHFCEECGADFREEEERRAIREVLYALEKRFGAEEVLNQVEFLETHDTAFAAVEIERKAGDLLERMDR